MISDGAHWRTITVSQPDGTRIEYGFFPSAESGHVPAFVARCRRTAAGDWTPVEFWDATYSDAPARRPLERRGAAPLSAREAWAASGTPERRRTA